MKNQKKGIFFPLIFMIMWSSSMFSQSKIISGTLTDSNGLPLPGVSVVVLGKNVGTQTDFDGNYSISCAIGDTLSYSYIGQKTKHIVVTVEMFNTGLAHNITPKKAVEKIKSNAYTMALENIDQYRYRLKSILDSDHTFNWYGNYFQYQKIKDIHYKKNRVDLSYFSPDVYYETGVYSKIGFQYIKKSNLAQVQSSFSQGGPSNGMTTFLGPSTETIFSYGPALNTLEFDGGTSPFDQNGTLVPIGTGNGVPANNYSNSIYETAIKTVNTFFFNINTDHDFLGLEYSNSSNRDIYDKERSSTHRYDLKYRHIPNTDDLEWNAYLKFNDVKDNQPNINGFHNNLLQNALATPASFNNNEREVLVDGQQRSFAPTRFNNPLWLLNTNRNQTKNQALLASLQNKFSISSTIHFKTALSYQYSKNQQQFGLIRNTVGFLDGYRSDKSINRQNFDFHINFNYKEYLNNHTNLSIISTLFYDHDQLDFDFFEGRGFLSTVFDFPQFSNGSTRKINRNTFRFFNKVAYKVHDWGTTFALINNTYASSIQDSKWWLPSAEIKTELGSLIDSHWLTGLNISSGISKDINYLPLYYTNQSHNALLLVPEESLNYTTNTDLFIDNAINLEEKISYEFSIALDFYIPYAPINLDITYYNNTINNSVFPVLDQDRFQLKNSADIRSNGLEINVEANIGGNYKSFSYRPSIVFSTLNTHVLRILDNSDRLPIAGFGTVSKNLIKGQPAGVLVGSVYERNSQGRIIIDNEGFPVIAQELSIIGDPTPDFNLGFQNTFQWKGFRLDFLIDYQKGGDVWNGTQNVLNYLGRSQQSANERSLLNFVFDGVDQEGNNNTIPVDFANPTQGLSGNRFIRYGYSGIAEEAIEDGSYFNLKSFNLSYDFSSQNSDGFFREFKIGVYGKNIITSTKYDGASPYRNFYDQSAGQGLHFFNTPITSEVGFQMNIKI